MLYRNCNIKTCTREKKYTGCQQCHEFPCKQIGDFPIPVGKKVILRGIPYWQEHGTEKWVADRGPQHMPGMWTQAVSGCKTINKCKSPVDLD